MSNQRGYLRSLNAQRAALWYRQPSRTLHVVLVSGEAGKSTTALYLYHILNTDRRRSAVFTNISSFIDQTPYPERFDQSASSLQAALAAARKAGCDYAIVELTPTINQSAILKTLHYNSILATTITTDLPTLFDRETEFVALPYAEESLTVPLAPHQIAYFGDQPAADIYIDKLTLHRGGTELDLILDHHNHYELASYLLGTLNTRNAAAAVAMAYILGVPTESFAEGIARLETVAGNLEKITGGTAYNLYVDAARSEASASVVVNDLVQLKKRRLLVALGRGFSLSFASSLAALADQVTVYGYDSVDGHLVLANDRETAIAVTARGARRDDTVLLLGAEFAQSGNQATKYIDDIVKDTHHNEPQN